MKQGLEPEPEPDSKAAEARRPGALVRTGLALFGWLSSALLRLLGATWRVEVLGRDPRVATDSAAAPRRPPGRPAA